MPAASGVNIPVYDLAVMALASGRIAYSITNDEIMRPMREWVFRRSAPHSGTIRIDTEDGYDDVPASMVHDGVFDPARSIRTPQFWGQLVECLMCMSFHTSLWILVAYLISAHWTVLALTPFALWGLSNAFAKWLHS